MGGRLLLRTRVGLPLLQLLLLLELGRQPLVRLLLLLRLLLVLRLLSLRIACRQLLIPRK